MMTMIGKQAKANYYGKEVNGTVYDVNNTNAWIETEEDMYIVSIDTVEIAKELTPFEQAEEAVKAWAASNDVKYSEIADLDDLSIILEGWQYHVTVTIKADTLKYEVCTRNTNRDTYDEYGRLEEVDTANERTIAKFPTLVKYLERYL